MTRQLLSVLACCVLAACADDARKTTYASGAARHDADAPATTARSWLDLPEGCEDVLADNPPENLGLASVEGQPDLVVVATTDGPACVDSRAAVLADLKDQLDATRAARLRAYFSGLAAADPSPHPDHPLDTEDTVAAAPIAGDDTASADPSPHPDKDADDSAASEGEVTIVIWIVIIIEVDDGTGEGGSNSNTSDATDGTGTPVADPSSAAADEAA